jgi:hypothetical protein
VDKTSSIKTIGVDELAHLIFRAVPTIKNDLYRKPKSLPPRIVMPGSKKLVWLEADVFAWMEQCRQVTTPLKVTPIRAVQKLDRRY